MLPRGELSLALAGLEEDPGAPWAAGSRAAIEWAAGLGYRWVQLDGRTLRARELSRSARRDIAALLRRLGLGFSGIDLWIHPEHFARGDSQDRAVRAVEGAMSLAADIRSLLDRGQAVVSVMLPPGLDDGLVAEMERSAERTGAMLADHAWPARSDDRLGIGIDPALIIAAKGDVVAAVASLSRAPLTARWRELGSRTPDALTYDAALFVRGCTAPRVVDLRDVTDQVRAATDMLRTWARVRGP